MAKIKTKKLICWKPTVFDAGKGAYSYQPGQTVEIPLDQPDPEGFIRTAVLSPKGEEIRRGPFYQCTKECDREGLSFKPGMLWPFPNLDPPEGIFEPLKVKAHG